jgi:hypothetical protein
MNLPTSVTTGFLFPLKTANQGSLYLTITIDSFFDKEVTTKQWCQALAPFLNIHKGKYTHFHTIFFNFSCTHHLYLHMALFAKWLEFK